MGAPLRHVRLLPFGLVMTSCKHLNACTPGTTGDDKEYDNEAVVKVGYGLRPIMGSMSAGSSTDTGPGPTFVTASGHTLWGHNYANITAPAHRKPDTLDKTVAFLAKRDGIDKVGLALFHT